MPTETFENYGDGDFPSDGFSAAWDGSRSPWRVTDETEPDSIALAGGEGYQNIVTENDADTVLGSGADSDDLTDAIANASNGEVIYVDEGASINIEDLQIDIGDGITLASNRGENGSAGATLYQDDHEAYPGFYTDDCRITGFDFRGPKVGQLSGGGWPGKPIECQGPTEIDNCEMYGQERHAIAVEGAYPDQPYIHHCKFYDNRGDSMGYSIASIREGGIPLIEYCYFENGRHDVTTNGDPQTGFIIRYCHFGPVTHRWPVDTHSADTDTYIVENTIFEATTQEYGGGGSPVHACQVDGHPDDNSFDNNWFFHDNRDDAFELRDTSFDRLNMGTNYYGPNAATYDDIIPGYDGDPDTGGGGGSTTTEDFVGDRALEFDASGTDRHALAWDAAEDHTDAEILTRFRIDRFGASSSSQGRSYLRAGGDDGSESGYFTSFTPDAFVLERYDGGDHEELDTHDIALSEGGWYYVRFRADGGNIQARVWPADDDEPEGTWHLDVFDEALTDGWAGIGSYNDSLTTWDTLSLEVDGVAPFPDTADVAAYDTAGGLYTTDGSGLNISRLDI